MKHKRLIVSLVLFLFFSEGFVRLTAQPWHPDRPTDAPSYHWADNGYIVPDDQSSTLYHFRNGERRTVGAPLHYQHTIWMFGNSALMGFKIGDADTLPSKLQALLPDYRVVNRSAEGQYLRGEVNWLKDTPIRVGDIIIFYDGLMDALTLDDSLRPVQPFVRAECDKSQPQHLSLILDTLLCGLVPKTAVDQEGLKAAAGAFQDNVHTAESYTLSHGAVFYQFMQPGAMETYGDTACVLIGERLSALPETFLDVNGHLDAQGNEQVAQTIYNHLTIF